MPTTAPENARRTARPGAQSPVERVEALRLRRPAPDWDGALALPAAAPPVFGSPAFEPVRSLARSGWSISTTSDEQKARWRNTRQFVEGRRPTTCCSPVRAEPASPRSSRPALTGTIRRTCASSGDRTTLGRPARHRRARRRSFRAVHRLLRRLPSRRASRGTRRSRPSSTARSRRSRTTSSCTPRRTGAT